MRWHSVLFNYGLFFVHAFFATLIVYMTRRTQAIDTIRDQLPTLYGYLRPLFVLLLFKNVPLDKGFPQRMLRAFIFSSIPLSILSIAQTFRLGFAERITLLGYTSPYRTPVDRMLEEFGVIIRSTGVFESPVYNALFFLMVLIAAGYSLIREGQRAMPAWLLYLGIGFALVSGLTTLSSTFLLGLVVCGFLFVLFLWPKHKGRFLRMAIGVACITGLLAFLLGPWLNKEGLFSGILQYKIQRILSGNVLRTRYDPQKGTLAGTFQAIRERPILGWGFAQAEGAFVGDSIYATVMYRTGIIGSIFFFWTLWKILRYTWKHRKAKTPINDINQIAFLTTSLLIAVGVGCVSFIVPRLQEWYWAFVGTSLNNVFSQPHETAIKIGIQIKK